MTFARKRLLRYKMLPTASPGSSSIRALRTLAENVSFNSISARRFFNSGSKKSHILSFLDMNCCSASLAEKIILFWVPISAVHDRNFSYSGFWKGCFTIILCGIIFCLVAFRIKLVRSTISIPTTISSNSCFSSTAWIAIFMQFVPSDQSPCNLPFWLVWFSYKSMIFAICFATCSYKKAIFFTSFISVCYHTEFLLHPYTFSHNPSCLLYRHPYCAHVLPRLFRIAFYLSCSLTFNCISHYNI